MFFVQIHHQFTMNSLIWLIPGASDIGANLEAVPSLGDEPLRIAMALVNSEQFAAICAADSEFLLHARYLTGGIRFAVGDSSVLGLRLENGAVSAGDPASDDVVDIFGPKDAWDKVLMRVPPRLMSQLWTATQTVLENRSKPLAWAQMYMAADRALELLREIVSGKAEQRPADEQPKPVGHIDEPVGRYVHVLLGGINHRIYFETAGQGIPMLLQHTAGSHGSQWRHLFERPEITSRFRLIAYDLPHHGKSIPPSGTEWWKTQYKLDKNRAMELPLALSKALGLDRPVFMGCSVGGLLALDLARYHPESFRAVIALEPALKIDVEFNDLGSFWDPRVSSEYKARLMRALTSPTSPEAFRRETEHMYAAGWPQAFLGDLFFYCADHDLTEAKIDTSKIGVFMLSGEYDASATLEHGRACHEKIKGSVFVEMLGLGHFPMSEDPDAFVSYLLPILDAIEDDK